MKKDDIEKRYEGFKIVPITREYFSMFYASESHPNTITGFCFLYWGEPVGVAGIEHYKTHNIIFSDIKNSDKLTKGLIYRCALFFMDFLKCRGGKYIALTESENERSNVLLDRLEMTKYADNGDYAYYFFSR